MEIEAAQRYAEFADAMETHNNREVAALFRKMADIEAQARRRRSWRRWAGPTLPVPRRASAFWEGFEGARDRAGRRSALPDAALARAASSRSRARSAPSASSRELARSRDDRRGAQGRARDARRGARARRARPRVDEEGAEARRRTGRSIPTRPATPTEAMRRCTSCFPKAGRRRSATRTASTSTPGASCSSPARSAGTRSRSSTREDLAPQFEQALDNVLAVLARGRRRAGAHLPDHRLLLRQARLPRRAARARRASGARAWATTTRR